MVSYNYQVWHEATKWYEHVSFSFNLLLFVSELIRQTSELTTNLRHIHTLSLLKIHLEYW